MFQSFHDASKLRPFNHRSSGSNILAGSSSSVHRPPFDPRIAALVAEAGDQAHAFAYQFKMDHEMSLSAFGGPM